MKDKNAPMTHGEFQTMLDHITSERLEVQNYVHEEMEKVNNKVDALQTGVSNLKRDMTQVKQDVSAVKTGMTQVKDDVNTIASELGIEIAKKKKAS